MSIRHGRHARRGTHPQESKVLSYEGYPWRVEEEEAAQNSLRILVIELGKLGRCAAIFLLHLLDVLVAKVSNSTEVEKEEYDYSTNNGRLSEVACGILKDGDWATHRSIVHSNGGVYDAER